MKRPLITFTILFLVSATSFSSGQEPVDRDDHALAQGLNDRQLYSLAESLCRRQIEGQHAASPELSEWTIELIKTLTLAAASSDTDQRDNAWHRVNEAANQFIKDHSSHPRLVLLRIQSALSQLARAHVISQEIQAQLQSIAAAASALELLQNVSRELQSIDRDIDSMVASAPDKARDNDARLTKLELQNLKTNIAVQLARCNVERALLMSDENPFDRLDILRRANNDLDSVLRKTNSDQPLWWEVQIDSAKILRLQNDLAGASRLLATLDKNQANPATQSLIEEESSRLILASGNLNSMQQLVQSVRLETRRPATYDLVLMEIALKLAEASKDEQVKAFARQRAVDLVKVVDLHHGTYWARRANLLLTNSLGGESAQPSDAQILLRVASEAERKQQWAEAVSAYDKAANAFHTSNLPDLELKVRYRVGLIVQQLKQHQNAFDRFQHIARQFAESEDAPQASLLAIWNYSQTIAQHPERTDEYRGLLDQHLERWISHETSGKILIWRAGLLARAGRFVDAIHDLLQVPKENKSFDEAIELAAGWTDAAFAETKRKATDENKNADRNYAVDLAGILESLLSDEPDQLPTTWAQSTRTIALLLARVNLTYFDSETSAMQRLLAAALDNNEQNNEQQSWRSHTAAWLVVALALESEERDQLQERLSQVTQPESWNQLMSGLASVASRTTDESRSKLLAQTQLLVSRSLDQQLDRLDKSQKVKWALAKARALETNGSRDEAIAELERLVKQYSSDASAQIALAEALTRGSSKTDWEKALGQWRTIAARTRNNSEHWFQAKYHVALLLTKTDQPQEALKLLEYVNAVPPGWSNSQLKNDFDELFRKVKKYP